MVTDHAPRLRERRAALTRHLGTVRLRDLTAARLDRHYGGLHKKGLAPRTIRNYHRVIHRACSRGVVWHLLPSNPAALATAPTGRTSEVQAPGHDEMAGLLDEAAVSDPALHVDVYLAPTTALRRGELCGLRWTDLRLDDTPPELTVKSNVVEAAGRVTVKDPKSHASRRLALDPETVSLLRRQYARSVEQALAFGLTVDDNSYVFSDDPGGRDPTKPGRLSARLRAAVRGAGLTNIGFHSLRHYSLSTLISEGIDVRTAAGRAGHGDSSVTLRTYAHVVRASDEAAESVVTQALKTHRHKRSAR